MEKLTRLEERTALLEEIVYKLIRIELGRTDSPGFEELLRRLDTNMDAK